MLFGRTAREAVAQGKDPVAELVKATRGFKLFQGVVTKADMKGDRGFTWWDVEMKGTGPYSGHTYKVYVKNENIVSWLDGVPDAMSPKGIEVFGPRHFGFNFDYVPIEQLYKQRKPLGTR
jgi:DUF917 family protein